MNKETENTNVGVVAEKAGTVTNQSNISIQVKSAKFGRPRKNLTKKVAFVNGVPRGKGKPKSGQLVEWREMPWDFKPEAK